MYRSRFWTMRQYAGFATAEETNRRFRYLLEQGQTGLSVAFDLPTQMGYDSDAREAEGEVGRVGVPISSLADMAVLLDGLPLGEVSTSMTINATAPILLALYVAAAEAQGVRASGSAGTTQNDILKEYIARGTYIFPPRPSMRLVTDVFEFCAARAPEVEHHLDLGLPHARGGGDRRPGAGLHPRRRDRLRRGGRRARARRRRLRRPAQLLLRRLVGAVRGGRQVPGRPPDVGDDHAGALRRDRTPRSMVCRFHVQTAGSSLTAQSVDNNVVRTTIQALSAVLGGAQSLHTNSRDEALALPTEEAARLALRTQQILAHEAGVTETPDPLAGSYYVETLTNELEAAAWAYLDEIEAMGGTLAAIERGFQQREIQEAAYRVQRAIESGDQVVVGVNKFRDDEVAHAADPQDRPGRRAAPDRAGPAGPGGALGDGLGRPRWTSSRRRARGDGNLMPAILDAVRAHATVGEISDRLRVAWGEHRELITV